MSTPTDRKKSGGKLSRSETVTVRLDPKLRYLADLAARKQRRTLSSYIEWAIEDSLQHVTLGPNENLRLADEAEQLWDVDAADRFARLAFKHPDLLTHEEQVLWKLVRENGWLWRGSFAGSENEWRWTVQEQSLIFQRLREHWLKFNAVAETGAGQKELPTWVKTKPKTAEVVSKKTSGFDDMDDDIPF